MVWFPGLAKYRKPDQLDQLIELGTVELGFLPSLGSNYSKFGTKFM